MKALITGGAGFVGRHVVKRFLQLGHEVTIVDNFYPGSGCKELNEWPEHLRPESGEKVKLIREDCRNFFRQYNQQSKEFDLVVHLAAVVGGRLTIENDPLAVGIDLSIDAEFFYWLSKIKYKPHRIYYFSSSAIYPIAYQTLECHKLLKEEMVLFDGGFIGQPDLTYGWSKLTGEYLAQITHKKYGHHVTCFRPFSGYGEDQDISYPFPSILNRAINKENPFIVWGSGRQMRDFIYIEDCIDGMLCIGEKVGDGSGINLSTAKPTSFYEFARIAFEIVNNSTEELVIKNTAEKPEGVFGRYGSTEKQNQLGFYYKYELSDGIKQCLKYWEREGRFK